MKLDVFSLVVLLGALQALFFGVYLYFSPSENRIQNRSLAFFILILSYNGFETLNWSSELGSYLFIFDIFPFVLVFGLGPSIYLYMRSFRTEVTIVNVWKHYLLVWAAFLLRLILLVMLLIQVKGAMNFPYLHRVADWSARISEPLSVAVFTVYWIFAIREYRRLVQEEKALAGKWLKTLLTVMGVFSFLWICTVSNYYFYDVGDGKYYVIEVALVIFVYWIGYTGYHRTRVIYITQQKKTQSYFDNLTATEVEHCMASVQKAMEADKLYLQPELSIASLAAYIGVNPKTLSAVLNQGLQKGFSEYVNTWRVEAVKQMILDPAKRYMTITGMAYDCGFNSQPTFQRAFKTVTGQTPRDFMSKQ